MGFINMTRGGGELNMGIKLWVERVGSGVEDRWWEGGSVPGVMPFDFIFVGKEEFFHLSIAGFNPFTANYYFDSYFLSFQYNIFLVLSRLPRERSFFFLLVWGLDLVGVGVLRFVFVK